MLDKRVRERRERIERERRERERRKAQLVGIISRGLNAHGIHIKFSLQTAHFFSGLASRRTAVAS